MSKTNYVTEWLILPKNLNILLLLRVFRVKFLTPQALKSDRPGLILASATYQCLNAHCFSSSKRCKKVINKVCLL